MYTSPITEPIAQADLYAMQSYKGTCMAMTSSYVRGTASGHGFVLTASHVQVPLQRCF